MLWNNNNTSAASLQWKRKSRNKVPRNIRKSRDKESALARVAIEEQQEDKARAIPNDNQKHHFPHYFTDTVDFETLLKREHFINVFSGCNIASWTYSGVPFPKHKVRFYDDCKSFYAEHNVSTEQRDVNSTSITNKLQSGDTLYVEFMKISHFVEHTLPKITVDIVLISGQNHLVPQKPKPLDYVWTRDEFDTITNNPYITHWFLMNMDVYAHDPNHPKLHPWPYGLGSTGKHTPDTAEVGMNPMQAFRQELSVTDAKKNNSIFVGYFSMRTNKAKRRVIPQGEKLHPQFHFLHMHISKFVVSPDGDRPDCYRHYESIGMGAMPITQLSPTYYRHFGQNVIYNNTNWNLTELEATLPQQPKVNRRLIFQEYWMEHVERIVGRPLTWWDSTRQARVFLQDITNEVAKSEMATLLE